MPATIIDGKAEVAPCRHGLLFALRGGWTLAPAETLAQDQGVWWGDTPQGWQVTPSTPDALLLAVRILGETSDQLLDLLQRRELDLAVGRFSAPMQHNRFDFEPLAPFATSSRPR